MFIREVTRVEILELWCSILPATACHMYAHTAWAKIMIYYTALITRGIHDAHYELRILIQWVNTAIRNVILVLCLIVKGKFNILAIRATHGSVCHGTTLVSFTKLNQIFQ